jgi:hypothetical protein
MAGIILLLLTTRISSESPFYQIPLALGVTLITSATVSLLYEIFLRLDVEAFSSIKVMEQLKATGQITSKFEKTGLIDAGLNRSELDVKEIVVSASGFLKIFACSNAMDFTSPQCLSLIKEKMTKDSSFYVQILLVNPFGVVSFRRGQAPAYGKQEQELFCNALRLKILQLKSYMENLDSNGGSCKKRFDVRLYTTIPTSFHMITQNAVVVAPYVVTKSGSLSPYVIYVGDSRAHDLYIKGFDYTWNISDSISTTLLDDLKKKTLDEERHILDEISKRQVE